jgi:hypothetical protein
MKGLLQPSPQQFHKYARVLHDAPLPASSKAQPTKIYKTRTDAAASSLRYSASSNSKCNFMSNGVGGRDVRASGPLDRQVKVAKMTYTQKWPRLFEQYSPTFKWTLYGLQKVQSYPRGVTRGAPGI